MIKLLAHLSTKFAGQRRRFLESGDRSPHQYRSNMSSMNG